MKDKEVQQKDRQPLPRGWKLVKLRLRRACAWSVGLVYFISGLLKIIDPTGAGLVMEEYFRFLHMDLMLPVAGIAGTTFALLETILGAALLTGVWRKIIAISITVLHCFFTVITLVLLIFNPTMDCGCFGEAIHLTHLETFIKNLILLLLILAAFVPYRRFGTTKKRKYVSFGTISVLMLFFMVWSLTHLPVADFTAFAPGTTILAGNKHIDADEIYESVFIYSKDGNEKEFSLDNLPDSTWTFVNTLTKVKEHEGTPVLSFYDDYGFFQDSLAAAGKIAVISIYDPGLKEKNWKKISNMVRKTAAAGFTPLLLISDDRSEDTMPEAMREELGSHIYHSDFKTLITLNRSNGGLTYINEGYIVCKSTAHAYPDLEELREVWSDNPQTQMMEKMNGGSLMLQMILLICFIMIVFV